MFNMMLSVKYPPRRKEIGRMFIDNNLFLRFCGDQDAIITVF